MIHTSHDIDVYDTTNPELKILTDANLGAIKDGIADIERVMSGSITNFVDGVVVVGSENKNAWTSDAYPRHVVILDAILREDLSEIQTVVRHETVHTVDLQYGISDQVTFADFFNC